MSRFKLLSQALFAVVVLSLWAGAALAKAGAKVSFVNAVHGSELVPPMVKPAAPGLPAAISSGNPVGYVLQIDNGPTIYHTGDTDVFSDMKLIAEFFKVDLMLAALEKRGLGARMLEKKPGESWSY